MNEIGDDDPKPQDSRDWLQEFVSLTLIAAWSMAFIGIFVDPLKSLAATAYIYVVTQLMKSE